MSKKYNNVRRVLNYFEHFLVFASAFSGCFSISAFASLVGVPVGIASSTVELKICTLALVDSYVNHDEFVNVLRKYSEMKEEIKNPENAVEYTM